MNKGQKTGGSIMGEKQTPPFGLGNTISNVLKLLIFLGLIVLAVYFRQIFKTFGQLPDAVRQVWINEGTIKELAYRVSANEKMIERLDERTDHD
jgi:hypothetical protein